MSGEDCCVIVLAKEATDEGRRLPRRNLILLVVVGGELCILFEKRAHFCAVQYCVRNHRSTVLLMSHERTFSTIKLCAVN